MAEFSTLGQQLMAQLLKKDLDAASLLQLAAAVDKPPAPLYKKGDWVMLQTSTDPTRLFPVLITGDPEWFQSTLVPTPEINGKPTWNGGYWRHATSVILTAEQWIVGTVEPLPVGTLIFPVVFGKKSQVCPHHLES